MPDDSTIGCERFHYRWSNTVFGHREAWLGLALTSLFLLISGSVHIHCLSVSNGAISLAQGKLTSIN